MTSLTVLAGVLVLAAQPPRAHSIDEIVGTWKGTSVCTDRVAAPACQDETVVYEVRAGSKPGTAVLKADKVVNGERVPMGDLEFAYDATEGCWRSDFESPRVRSRWCFTIDGRTLTGTARLSPGNQTIRRVAVVRDDGRPDR